MPVRSSCTQTPAGLKADVVSSDPDTAELARKTQLVLKAAVTEDKKECFVVMDEEGGAAGTSMSSVMRYSLADDFLASKGETVIHFVCLSLLFLLFRLSVCPQLTCLPSTNPT